MYRKAKKTMKPNKKKVKNFAIPIFCKESTIRLSKSLQRNLRLTLWKNSIKNLRLYSENLAI
jgi:hypothetical protein